MSELIKRLEVLERAKAATTIHRPTTDGERVAAFGVYFSRCRSRYPQLLPANDEGWWPFETGKPNTIRDDAIEALARTGDPVVQLLLNALARKNAAEGRDLL
ncbi:hypothetical protein PQQ86_11810 [Paraburkholderia sediminicola]|uniref:hypothetical protein n=1 Tax=Paraburkholderia TaxID=1822464 RepID=UPI0038BA7933